jgi:hypothetical protein
VGGGLTVSGGSPLGVLDISYDVSGNSINGAAGTALTVNYINGGGMVSGQVNNNLIGTMGMLNSGSQSGPGISVGAAVDVMHDTLIFGNMINEVRPSLGGLEIIANVDVGMTAVVNGNTINLSSDPLCFALSALYGLLGGGGAETGTLCLDMNNNTFNTAGPFSGNAIYLEQISTMANFNFPTYGGSPNGELAAVPGTASADLDPFFAGLGNTTVNGPFPSIAGSTDAQVIVGATGVACP